LKQEDLSAERAQIEAYFQRFHPEALPVALEVVPDPEHKSNKWIWRTRYMGTDRITVIDYTFFESPDYAELRDLADHFTTFGAPPYLVSYDEEAIELPTIEAVVERIMDGTRKGLNIQRYKGLGEMNPDQL